MVQINISGIIHLFRNDQKLAVGQKMLENIWINFTEYFCSSANINWFLASSNINGDVNISSEYTNLCIQTYSLVEIFSKQHVVLRWNLR